jgi:hypothetical protein
MHFKLRGIASPFMVEIAWRIDAIAACWTEKGTNQATVVSYSTINSINDKIKKALNYKFLDMKEYIKTHFKLEGILFGFEYYSLRNLLWIGTFFYLTKNLSSAAFFFLLASFCF